MSNKKSIEESFFKKIDEKLIRRVTLDIDSIYKIAGVNKIIFNQETSEIEIFYKEDIYKFELPKLYPFEPVKFYRNNNEINLISLINNHSPSITLIQLFNFQIDRDNSKYKILIFCHPYIIKEKKINNIKNNHHFLNKDIIILCKELGIKETDSLIIDTIDLLPGAVYRNNGFSDEFINGNLGRYDFVFIPDCGGLWYQLQEKSLFEGGKEIYKFNKREIEYNLTLLIDHILKVLKLVKNNGIIAFSKILFREECKIRNHTFTNFIDAIQFYLHKNGFNSYVRKLINYNNEDIIVGRKIL
jgi:hypothetical protein